MLLLIYPIILILTMTMTKTLINLLFPFLLPPLLFRLLKIHHLLLPLSHLKIVLIIVMESTILSISVTHSKFQSTTKKSKAQLSAEEAFQAIKTGGTKLSARSLNKPKNFCLSAHCQWCNEEKEIYICCEVYQNTISKAVTVTTTKKLKRVQKRSPHISDNENDNQKRSFIVIAIPAGSAISVVLPSASLHSELVSLPASDAASVSMFASSELPQDMG